MKITNPEALLHSAVWAECHLKDEIRFCRSLISACQSAWEPGSHELAAPLKALWCHVEQGSPCSTFEWKWGRASFAGPKLATLAMSRGLEVYAIAILAADRINGHSEADLGTLGRALGHEAKWLRNEAQSDILHRFEWCHSIISEKISEYVDIDGSLMLEHRDDGVPMIRRPRLIGETIFPDYCPSFGGTELVTPPVLLNRPETVHFDGLSKCQCQDGFSDNQLDRCPGCTFGVVGPLDHPFREWAERGLSETAAAAYYRRGFTPSLAQAAVMFGWSANRGLPRDIEEMRAFARANAPKAEVVSRG